MRTRNTLKTLILIGIVVLSFNIAKSYQTGALPQYTGAPNDAPNACGYPGCHSIAPITNSNALQITMIDPNTNQPVTSYQAKKKYTVKIELTYRSLKACGFESTVEIANAPYTHIGTIAGMTTGNTRSWLPYNGSVQYGNDYVTHSSSTETTPGYGMWEYSWTSPSTGQGDIIIYAAGNSAQGHDIQTEDTIFTTNKTFTFNSASSIDNQILDKSNVSIYPNPASDNFTIGCSLSQEENIAIDLYSIKGQYIKSILSGPLPQGDNKINTDIKGLPTGLYFLRITMGGESSVEKVMIN